MSSIALPAPRTESLVPDWLKKLLGALAVLFALIYQYGTPEIPESGGQDWDCTAIDEETAASATEAAVSAAITAVDAGGCVYVPSNSTNAWDALEFPEKSFKLIGATTVECTGSIENQDYACAQSGGTATTITGTPAFAINLGAKQSVEGFVIQCGDGECIGEVGDASASSEVYQRIHHNVLSSTDDWAPMRFQGSDNGVHPQILIDHNRLGNGISIHAVGTFDNSVNTAETQNIFWAENVAMGEFGGRIVVESNYFVKTPGSHTTNYGDGNYGARGLIRFNYYDGPATSGLEFHSVQGDNRGYQRWEAYYNVFDDLDTTDDCFWGSFLVRGGTGVVFNNAMIGDFDGCNLKFSVDNVRSADDDTIVFFDVCDGTSSPSGVDENTPGQQGWHCRDQIGVSHDAVQWSFNGGSPDAWNQVLVPAYMWGNTVGGSYYSWDIADWERNPTHIQADRDLFIEDESFDGTSGVGIGARSSRPETCTTGVAYWSTDQGSWNTTEDGGQGVLDRCTSTNTWTDAWYTPATYPDPRTIPAS